MRRKALIAVVPVTAALVALVASSAPAAPSLTPDQQLVTSLETVRDASRDALRNMRHRSAAGAARADLARASAAAAAAQSVAGRAVGALEAASVQRALRRVPGLLRQARGDVAARRLAAARAKAQAAHTLAVTALQEFGMPLEREFSTFAVDRDFRGIRGFANYSGFTATAAEEVTEVVIGAADRETANAGEADSAAVESGGGLPITQMSVYIIRDPIGRFTSNWCRLADGLITCSLNPTLRPDHSYTIAFGPKLARGTKVLVKFRTRDGRRSFSVFSTR